MTTHPSRRLVPAEYLESHLRLVSQLPAVVTSETLFGNSQPLELEIGSGKGLFMESASGSRPQHNFLGVEIAHKYAAQAAGRLAKAGRGNALMVSGDAQPLLEKSFPDQSLAAVHIYFPDPWWKKKHKKRRVVNPTSAAQLFRLLAAGGRLHFWTDVLEYFESVIEMLAEELPQFGPPLPEEIDSPSPAAARQQPSGAAAEGTAAEGVAPASPPVYRTHFERRSRLHQIPVYRVRYEKPRSPAPVTAR